MFLLESDDLLSASSISSILKQKGIFHTLEKDEKYFFTLKLIQKNKYIELKSDTNSLKIETPTTISLIIKNISQSFNNFNLDIKGAKFYPLKRSLVYKNKEAFLGDIHFIIFSQLMLNSDQGLDKIKLYKDIWPLDKDLQLNKLDTHLTNLKNHLKEKLNLNLLFFSRSGLIYISVD
ncbi:hypothetical protein N9M54_00715 [Alphaproteobacteria bacterium]|nr:hypothetical protein [Alphaproteobacteria bacterium]